MKRWVKIVLTVVAAFVALIVAAIVILQIPSVQRSLCHSILNSVSKSTELEIKAGDFHLALVDRVIIEDVAVVDGRDTLISCRRAAISISPVALLNNNIKIKRISLDKGAVYPSRFPASKKEKDTTAFSLPKLNLQVRRATLNDFKVILYNQDGDHTNRILDPRKIDFNDLLITDLYADIRDVDYTGERADVKVCKVGFREAGSGTVLENLSFMAAYDTAGLHIRDFNFNDTFSDFNIPRADLGFNSFEDFGDFFNKVQIDATVQDALLDFRTIQHIADSIGFLELKLIIDGRVTGTVADLKTESLHVYSGTRESFLDLTAHLVGLPDALATMATIKVNRSYTSTRDIAQIVWECTLHKNLFDRRSVSSLAPGTRFSFNGTLNGFFLDFVAYGALHSNIGGGRVDIICRDVDFKGYEVLGYLDVRDFDLGHFLQVNTLGKATCHASMSSYFADNERDTEVYIEEIQIPKLEFNGYTYSNIYAAGNFKCEEIEGRIVSADPNLKFMLQGILAPSGTSGNSLYHLKLSLGHADLAALNFDKRPVSTARLNASADITQTPDGRLMGKVSLTDIECKSPDGTFPLDDIDIVAFNGTKHYMLGINSRMLRARYRGSAFVTSIIPQLEGLVFQGKMDNLAKRLSLEPMAGTDRYDLQVKAFDLRNLLGFLSPGTHIESGTTLTLQTPGDNTGSLTVKSDLVAFNNLFIQGLDAGFDFSRQRMTANVNTDQIRLGDIALRSGNLKADCAGNSAFVNMGYSNDPDSLDAAHLQATLSFPTPKESKEHMLLHLGNSFVKIGGERWDIDPSSVYFADRHITINDFKLYNQHQGVSANGILSASTRDTCAFDVKNLDLSLVNMLMKNPLNISGSLSGSGKLTAPYSSPDVIADMTVDSLCFAGQQLGHIEVSSVWDDTLHRANLLARNIIQGRQALTATGYYKPEDESLFAQINTDKFNIGIIEPFISSIATDISGELTASVTVSGSLSKPDISCRNGHLENAGAKLVYTQVPYTMDGYIDISNRLIRLSDFEIADAENGKGTLAGAITHDHFKDLKLDINIRADNLIGFDTTRDDNETFYGKAYATGRVSLSGPSNGLALNINATTRKGTVVNIPIGNATTTQTSILTFVDNRPKPRMSSIDSLINLHRAKEQASETAGGGGLDVFVRVRATEDADVNIELDSNTSDALQVKGTGTVDISVKDNNFSITGDYTVSEGNYQLALLGLVTRDFTLENGSTIHFTGDIMQSELNMTAAYKTKASISPLVAMAGNSGNSSLRRPVNCGIRVTDRLANPSLGFNIDIDDLDPTTQALIDNTINTEEKRMRQFLALLISGSFIPDEQSGIVNNTSVSYFNATEIMSNQLNNIFQQLDIPIDLGFNYQPTSTGEDLFDVAVSTQLMNNRVSVNGNIGNRRYLTSTREDIVGDVDVEIKLGTRGKTRLSLFSHSADEYSNYLDQTQRNGIGISYQEEFNTLKDLFRRNANSKKRGAPPVGKAPASESPKEEK